MDLAATNQAFITFFAVINPIGSLPVCVIAPAACRTTSATAVR